MNSSYGNLPKTSNTLNIRTSKIIAKNNFKMFPKISNSGLFSEIEFLKFRTESFFLKFRTVNFIQILISKTSNRKKNNDFFLFKVLGKLRYLE